MKQTAGRDKLGSIAKEFAELNDDVLFGRVWSREDKLNKKIELYDSGKLEYLLKE